MSESQQESKLSILCDNQELYHTALPGLGTPFQTEPHIRETPIGVAVLVIHVYKHYICILIIQLPNNA